MGRGILPEGDQKASAHLMAGKPAGAFLRRALLWWLSRARSDDLPREERAQGPNAAIAPESERNRSRS